MFKIGNDTFYFDIEEMSQFIRLDVDEFLKRNDKFLDKMLGKDDEESDENEPQPEDLTNQMVDITKWEMAKTMVEVLLMERPDIDEKMLESELPISFKLAFNTLSKYKIIKTK